MELRIRAIDGVELRCALCHDALGEGRWRCVRCGSLAHEECATESSCPTLGCVEAKPPRARIRVALQGAALGTTDAWRALRRFMIGITVLGSLILGIVIALAEGSALAPFILTIH